MGERFCQIGLRRLRVNSTVFAALEGTFFFFFFFFKDISKYCVKYSKVSKKERSRDSKLKKGDGECRYLNIIYYKHY